MAEKHVSVRLAAVGGRQVRAELEGVGEAGAKGFGRLSQEMEAANQRLAAFARTARVAATAAGAAALAALGAVTRATIASANATQQFARVANATPEAFQRWAAAARTVGIEEEKLADILKDVNDRIGEFVVTGGGPMRDFFEQVAPRIGITADAFARLSGSEALQLFVSSMERAGLSQQQITFYLEAMASDATRLLPLLRAGGAGMARLGERATDLGAVLDSEAIRALERTEVALIGVGQVFEGLRNRIGVALAPAVEWLANAFVGLASSGGALRAAIDALLGNLARLASYAATFAAFMAGRWVAGLAMAALSVRGLATALVVLRGALIRTGIGALIIAAGELVFQFARLVRGAGGFGAALGLMGDVAKAVWAGLKATVGSLADDFRAVRADIEAIWLRLMAFLSERWAEFLAQIGPSFNAVAEEIGAGSRIDWIGALSRASMLDHAARNAGSRAEGYRARASALGLRGQGARDRRRHRPEPRRRLPRGGERRGRVREDRQARLPRPRHLAHHRPREARRPALHPRPALERARRHSRTGGRCVRERPALGRHGRLGRPGAHGACHGLHRGPADACRRCGWPPPRRSPGHPATRRARPLAPRGAGGVNVTVVARDVESFRQSRTQIAADIARAVALGRRGM